MIIDLHCATTTTTTLVLLTITIVTLVITVFAVAVPITGTACAAVITSLDIASRQSHAAETVSFENMQLSHCFIDLYNLAQLNVLRMSCS